MFICSVRKYGTRQQIFVTVFVVITIWKENSASDLFSFRYAAATKNFSWHLSFIIWFLVTGCSNEKNNFVQVNLCQKLFFLHQLTHTMTTDCSLNYKFNTWKFLAQNMGRTCCVQKLFLTFRTISVHNMLSKKKSFWQRFNCKKDIILVSMTNKYFALDISLGL